MTPRLAMLGGEGESTNIVANELRRRFGNFPLILERRMPGLELARRRARRLGYWKVAGQVLFVVIAAHWLRLRSKSRIQEIQRLFGLDPTPVSSGVIPVSSVNSEECIRLLQACNPELVVVNGTRILSRRVLASTGARFLNMHAGIAPAFRGCHGAYWARATGRPELAGTTIHWVDEGIDTGGVVKQALIQFGVRDNFATYPYLQMAVGLPLLSQTVAEFFEGNVTTSAVSGHEAAGSHLYHHPTLWSYAIGRLRGVK